jgi:hypothetical protein
MTAFFVSSNERLDKVLTVVAFWSLALWMIARTP